MSDRATPPDPRDTKGIGHWRNPLWQLTLANMRNLLRAGSSIIFIFGLPIFLSVIMGLAFQGRGGKDATVTIAIPPGADGDALVQRLGTRPDLVVLRLAAPEAELALQRGETAAIVTPGEVPDVKVDATQVAGIAASQLLSATLGVQVHEQKVKTPGRRYIDFVIPGLIALALMNQCLSLGMSLVWLRSGRLMRRLGATPMRRIDFLLSYAITRTVVCLMLVALTVVFARLVFNVHVSGSYLALLVVAIVGSLCFCGMGVLVGSRTEHTEVAGGITQLTVFAMLMASGVFFPVRSFPTWLHPVLMNTPMTALADGLRGVMNEGASLIGIKRPLLVLAGYGVAFFSIAVRVFRWN